MPLFSEKPESDIDSSHAKSSLLVFSSSLLLTFLGIYVLISFVSYDAVSYHPEIFWPLVLNLITGLSGFAVMIRAIEKRWRPQGILGFMSGEFVLKILLLIGLLAAGVHLLGWDPGIAVISFVAAFVAGYALRLTLLIRYVKQRTKTITESSRS